MKRLNFILIMAKYDIQASKLFSYHIRGKWGRKYNYDYGIVRFNNQNK